MAAKTDPKDGLTVPGNDPSRNLRLQAEAIAAAWREEDLGALSPEQIRHLVHELRVHQIELEMQNDELRRAQEALETSRARYFDLYNLAPVGYVTVSEQGLILEANLTASSLLATPRASLVSQPLTRFIVAEDQDIYYQHRKRLFETGEPQVCELRMKKQDGISVWVRLEAVVARDEDNGNCVCRATISDITGRKQGEEEQEKLQAQLNQARKMESIGRLAGGVAHDFNNMLGVIIGHTELALSQVDTANPLFAALQEIRKAAARSADLTRQLLAFARKQTVVPRILDLNETVEGMLNMLRRLIGEDIDINWRPEAGVCPVRIDPSQIDQILANLCVNARDAISGVGKITIETCTVIFDQAYFADHPGFVPGQYAQLSLNDTGSGMDKDTLDKLFEPFFTTKQIGKGTGLGLATVYGIVKQNHGFINVTSEPGQGTTFRIYLPRCKVKSRPMRKEGTTIPAAKDHETILLVEDEPSILTLCKMMLESIGYRVLVASTPGEAMRLAKEHAGKIHLLITDVVMPEMNGQELAKNLISYLPGLKRLYMSGYTGDIIAKHSLLDEDTDFIQKPFLLQALAVKVRHVLDGR